jgi:hypothetical protein
MQSDRIATLIDDCADRALLYAHAKDSPLYFVALLGHALCNEGADVGRKLLDIIDMSTTATNIEGLPI